MTKHVLKLNDKYYDAVSIGKKTFEIRKNDRSYNIGDVLWLYRVDDNGEPIYSEKTESQDFMVRTVDYIITDKDFPEGLKEGYVILGIKR